MSFRLPKTLSDAELADVTKQQEAQQAAWQSLGPEGASVACLGKTFHVHPGVFPPRRDSRFLVEHLRMERGASVLDLGTGSGVLAVFAAAKGAGKVVAVDLNPDAVACATENAAAHGYGSIIETRESNVFSAIGTGESFDVVIANLPGRDKAAPDIVAAAQWDSGFQTHRAFFADVGKHLKPDGKIFMCKANYPEVDTMLRLAEDAGMETEVVAKSAMSGGDPRIYHVFAFKRAAGAR